VRVRVRVLPLQELAQTSPVLAREGLEGRTLTGYARHRLQFPHLHARLSPFYDAWLGIGRGPRPAR